MQGDIIGVCWDCKTINQIVEGKMVPYLTKHYGHKLTLTKENADGTLDFTDYGEELEAEG